MKKCKQVLVELTDSEEDDGAVVMVPPCSPRALNKIQSGSGGFELI